MIEHITRAVNLCAKTVIKNKRNRNFTENKELNSDRWKSALLKVLLHLFTMIFLMCNAVFFVGGGGRYLIMFHETTNK